MASRPRLARRLPSRPRLTQRLPPHGAFQRVYARLGDAAAQMSERARQQAILHGEATYSIVPDVDALLRAAPARHLLAAARDLRAQLAPVRDEAALMRSHASDAAAAFVRAIQPAAPPLCDVGVALSPLEGEVGARCRALAALAVYAQILHSWVRARERGLFEIDADPGACEDHVRAVCGIMSPIGGSDAGAGFGVPTRLWAGELITAASVRVNAGAKNEEAIDADADLAAMAAAESPDELVQLFARL